MKPANAPLASAPMAPTIELIPLKNVEMSSVALSADSTCSSAPRLSTTLELSEALRRIPGSASASPFAPSTTARDDDQTDDEQDQGQEEDGEGDAGALADLRPPGE